MLESLTPTAFLIIIAAGFIGGSVSALTGGAGFFTIPAMVHLNMSIPVAVGTHKLNIAFSNLTSVWALRRQGKLPVRPYLVSLGVTLIGSMAGALLLNLLPIIFLKKAIPIMLLVFSNSILLKKWLTKKKSKDEAVIPFRLSPAPYYALMLVFGITGGAIGLGNGPIYIGLALARYQVDVLEAAAFSRLMCLVLNVTSFLVLASVGNVNWIVGLPLVLAGVAGTYLGVYVWSRMNPKYILAATMIFIWATAIDLFFA